MHTQDQNALLRILCASCWRRTPWLLSVPSPAVPSSPAGCSGVNCPHYEDRRFLDADQIPFTAPGQLEAPRDLEEQLARQLVMAREWAEEVIVLYGAWCFVDFSDPLRGVRALIREQEHVIRRVDAVNGVGMLADAQEQGESPIGKGPARQSSGATFSRTGTRGRRTRRLCRTIGPCCLTAPTSSSVGQGRSRRV